MADGWCVSHLQCQRSWSQAVASRITAWLCLSHFAQLAQLLLTCTPSHSTHGELMLPTEHRHVSSCTSQPSCLAAVIWDQAPKSRWEPATVCYSLSGSSNRIHGLSEALWGNKSLVIAWSVPHQMTLWKCQYMHCVTEATCTHLSSSMVLSLSTNQPVNTVIC